jgi:hypothetical protein
MQSIPPKEPTHTPTEYAQTLGTEPPVLPIDTDSLDMDKIKTLLNGYAKKHGVEAAYGLVEKLSGGSKNPADIPKDKYSYMVEACLVEGV